jgi:hypothetical protein
MLGLAASAAIQGAPALLGGIASLTGKNKYKEDDEYKKYNSLYKTLSEENAKPYLETSGAKSVLAAIREANDRRIKRITAASAVNGLTDEAKVAAMGNVQEGEAQAISGLSGNADQYRKDNLNQRLGLAEGMSGIKDKYTDKKNTAISNIVNPMSSAASGFVLSDAMGAGKKNPLDGILANNSNINQLIA